MCMQFCITSNEHQIVFFFTIFESLSSDSRNPCIAVLACDVMRMKYYIVFSMKNGEYFWIMEFTVRVLEPCHVHTVTEDKGGLYDD